MDGLALSTTTTTSTTIAHSSLFGNGFLFPSIQRKSTTGKRRALWFPKRTQFVVLAAKDEPRFDQWDQMELKFGRMIGEDPKLTLAKIMARKVNPDVSFHEVEKSFYKNKGEMAEIEVLPFDVGRGKKEVKESKSVDGLNLVRPVLKNGITFEDEGNKPMMVKKPIKHVGEGFDNNVTKRSVPNVILRKPSMFAEDDVDDKGSKSKVRIKPNLTLNMRSDQTNDRGTFSDMTLLRKPEPMSVGNAEAKANNDSVGIIMEREEGNTEYGGFALLQKPEVKTCIDESSASEGEPIGTEQELERDSVLGMQPLERTDIESNSNEETVENDQDDTNLADFTANISVESPLLGKPKRLDQSVRVASPSVTEEAVPVNHDGYGNASSEVKDLPSASPSEDAHWSRAEKLFKTGDRVEVELISSSIGGFAVSFGSLVGFLPYRNLSTKWKFLAFESWLRQKGLDPSMYRKQLGIIGTYEATENNMSLDSNTIPKIDGKNGGEITPDMKLEDLLRIYDQEKLKFLSSFIGQRIKVNILMANRNLRKLIVSLRPKEKEEMVEKKRSLMAKLQIGDVVKCCIKKITYFGIFVEVEGVPALIHQSEVSWDATLDPGSYFKVGQILEAKVHQLDIALERIFLSLKEITPDPLMGALESVIDGDRDSLGANLQAAEADTEWADVESLVKELQQIEGIQSVSKGRFFLSPGLAPTFQVYMASMFENQYKLLARSGNKVQEVIVQASLSKEEMKSTILACTNRVE